jgi:3-deoxy-D-manno-octulosonate 8-phosphate phosphatase (KDO 8-P phosphatase)
MKMTPQLKKRIQNIKLLALDVDGILTDGRIVIDHQGKETKYFNVQDGYGIVFLKRNGFKVVIVSARSAEAVTARAQDLKIDKVYQDVRPKTKALAKIMNEFGVKRDEICFMGDDLPDACLLREVGLAVTVPNGRDEIKKMAHYVTMKKGGEGAVRELIELILKVQGKWIDICGKEME